MVTKYLCDSQQQRIDLEASMSPMMTKNKDYIYRLRLVAIYYYLSFLKTHHAVSNYGSPAPDLFCRTGLGYPKCKARIVCFFPEKNPWTMGGLRTKLVSEFGSDPLKKILFTQSYQTKSILS